MKAGGLFTRPEDFDALSEIKLWAGRTDDGSRSDLDFRRPARRLGGRAERPRQLPGQEVPHV